MGVFDSVWAKCPNCGEPVEFQSKAADCVLADYELHSVPAAIAVDIDGETEVCKGCGTIVEIGYNGTSNVQMFVTTV